MRERLVYWRLHSQKCKSVREIELAFLCYFSLCGRRVNRKREVRRGFRVMLALSIAREVEGRVDRKRESSSRASSIFSQYTRESDLFSFLPDILLPISTFSFSYILSSLFSLSTQYLLLSGIDTIDSSIYRSCLRSSLKCPSLAAAPSLRLFFSPSTGRR